LQRLSGRLLEVQEEERRRLARDLHDQTGQSLTSLLIGLRTLEDASTLEATRVQARNLRTITAQALDEVKRLAIGLRPALLDDLGLEAALKRLAKESAKTYGVSVDLHVKGLPNHRLSPPVETGLYRLAQEALTNTGRHAAARNVSVLLTCSESSVKLIVEDDGRGFDVEKALRLPGSSNHLGLLGMRERVALLNGTISVESTPGGGTTIYVQLPLETRPS
ncbi:MAG: sensor histidine kinase, partial [Nitrospirales bacterium]|nr:sensor histidine kinase [Nitrospirales bacterium]